MTDVLSEEELAGIADRNGTNKELIGSLPGGSADWLREAFSDIDSLLAHIRATSSRPSGAEAMREACLSVIPGGDICDPQEIADAIRALPIAPQEVSEEMIDAAKDAASRESNRWRVTGGPGPNFYLVEIQPIDSLKETVEIIPFSSQAVADFAREDKIIRAALQAALSVKEKKNG